MSEVHAIPTVYKGIEFRSRLEAKWAIVFDQLGWEYEYEPIDLKGYIPDFMLMLGRGQIIVEVKPAMTLDEMGDAAEKIERSGWQGEALIVGGRILHDWNAFGLLNENDHEQGVWWGAAVPFWCAIHDGLGFSHEFTSYGCRVCGHGDGDHHMTDPGAANLALIHAWNTATNAVKYQHGRR